MENERRPMVSKAYVAIPMVVIIVLIVIAFKKANTMREVRTALPRFF